jgi:plasmid stability protein
MASITVRNIPEEILEKIRILSETERRSLNSEIVSLLEYGLKGYGKGGMTASASRELQTSIWESLSGAWDDARSAEEIVADIYKARTKGRKVDL